LWSPHLYTEGQAVCNGHLSLPRKNILKWTNVDNLNNVRRETSRRFRNKKKEYLKAKIEELEANSKIKNIRDLYRDISNFKKGYQPRNNIVKDEKGDLITDCHSILARCRNHFSLLLNVYGVNDVRRREIHTKENPMTWDKCLWVWIGCWKLKRHKSPGIDQIPAELIKEGGRTILYEIHKLIISIWNRLFNFDVEYAIWRVQVIQDGLKLNGTPQLLVYIDDVNIFGGSVHTAGFKSVLGDRISWRLSWFPCVT